MPRDMNNDLASDIRSPYAACEFEENCMARGHSQTFSTILYVVGNIIRWATKLESRAPMRVCLLLLISVATYTLSGCLIVPYPAKPITTVFGGSINRNVLQSGTPRSSVTAVIGDSIIAAGPHFTWARVQFSDSGMYFALLGNPGGIIASDSARNWHAQNLMIEFDEQDRVRQYYVISDSKLLPEVNRLLNDGSLEEVKFPTPVILTLPIEPFYLSSAHPTGRLTLSDSGISWFVDRKLDVAVVALTNVRHRKTCAGSYTSEAALMNQSLCASFDLQTSGVSVHVATRVFARDLFVLVAYARKFPLERK